PIGTDGQRSRRGNVVVQDSRIVRFRETDDGRGRPGCSSCDRLTGPKHPRNRVELEKVGPDIPRRRDGSRRPGRPPGNDLPVDEWATCYRAMSDAVTVLQEGEAAVLRKALDELV